MASVEVGKFTLESLTTGMYNDPMVIFREYIQNCTDSIDIALSKGILASYDKARIEVDVDPLKRSIRILDNGTGVKSKDVVEMLNNIGKSVKSHTSSSGFRGIGRLAAIPYSGKMTYRTSYKGEGVVTYLEWDCIYLREKMSPLNKEDLTLNELLSNATTIWHEEVDVDEHFCEVIIENVDSYQNMILDFEEVSTYLASNTPVPFNRQWFMYYSDSVGGIQTKFDEVGFRIKEYNIYVNNDLRLTKPYRSTVSTKKNKDDVRGIKTHFLYDESGSPICAIWYGITNFKGVIADSDVCGLRYRKNNILIGNGYTNDGLFSQERFNRWFIGEIHVLDEAVIPNARRDNFEQNKSYFEMKKALEKFVKDNLTYAPDLFSKFNTANRNINKASEEINDLKDKLLDEGVSSSFEKERIKSTLDDHKEKLQVHFKELEKTSKKMLDKGLNIPDVNSKIRSDEIIDDIDKTYGALKNAQYSVDLISAMKGMKSSSKKVVIEIMEIIDSKCSCEYSDHLKEAIINGLSKKKLR